MSVFSFGYVEWSRYSLESKVAVDTGASTVAVDIKVVVAVASGAVRMVEIVAETGTREVVRVLVTTMVCSLSSVDDAAAVDEVQSQVLVLVMKSVDSCLLTLLVMLGEIVIGAATVLEAGLEEVHGVTETIIREVTTLGS